MTSKDPYEVLGVSRQATADEIKRAYRKLAKQHHPDRNPGSKAAEQRFKEVQAAYEILGDPRKRAEYERARESGFAGDIPDWAQGVPGNFGGRVSFNFGDDLTSIFEQFFGGRARATQRRSPRRVAERGADIEHAVELSFEEALGGAQREVVLATPDGQQERVRFRVPAGVEDGQRVRVPGKGQPGVGGRGDLVVLCRVRPHPVFRRDGLDVLLDLHLSFPQAALGTEVEIQTPDGPAVLKVPAGTSSGAKLRLRGRGVRNARTGQRGDLYAVVRIDVPKALSPEARRLVERLASELAAPATR